MFFCDGRFVCMEAWLSGPLSHDPDEFPSFSLLLIVQGPSFFTFRPDLRASE